MKHVKIQTLQGDQIEGFLTTFKNLPKSAKCILYFYDNDLQVYSLYATFYNKTKYFIIKTN
jgi:hypothetical protein